MQRQIHSDPQDTTPQMTRLVILVIPCLKVCCISLTRSYIVAQFRLAHNLLTTNGAPGRTRTCIEAINLNPRS